MWVQVIPAARRNSSPAMCTGVPLPAEPKASASPRCLPTATKPETSVTFSEGCTASTIGAAAAWLMKLKSRIGS